MAPIFDLIGQNYNSCGLIGGVTWGGPIRRKKRTRKKAIKKPAPKSVCLSDVVLWSGFSKVFCLRGQDTKKLNRKGELSVLYLFIYLWDGVIAVTPCPSFLCVNNLSSIDRFYTVAHNCHLSRQKQIFTFADLKLKYFVLRHWNSCINWQDHRKSVAFLRFLDNQLTVSVEL